MWVIKTHGETFYVNHVTCELPWSTKETPDNSHTKGSLKIRECLLTINDNNEATLTKLNVWDRVRLRNQRLGITRITFKDRNFQKTLKDDDIKHGPVKSFAEGCGDTYYVCDLLDKNQVTFLGIKHHGKFRVLQANEKLYQVYDNPNISIDDVNGELEEA